MLSGAARRFIEVIVLADGVALVSGPLGSPPHGNERSDTLLFYQGAADLWLLVPSNRNGDASMDGRFVLSQDIGLMPIRRF